MQTKFFYYLFLTPCMVTGVPSSALFNAPDLGKTHFIVGMPVPQQKVAPIPDGHSNDLSVLLRCDDGSLKQVFFSPDDDLQSLLIKLIDAEQHSIRLAIFSFTDGQIAQALLQAKARGIDIEIITDISSLRDKFNKIDLLRKNGVTVHVYNPANLTIYNNIMHNKFVIFGKNVNGKSLVWTGSFNFTKSAKIYNQENVVILDSIHLIARYNKQFSVLKERIRKPALKLVTTKR